MTITVATEEHPDIGIAFWKRAQEAEPLIAGRTLPPFVASAATESESTIEVKIGYIGKKRIVGFTDDPSSRSIKEGD